MLLAAALAGKGAGVTELFHTGHTLSFFFFSPLFFPSLVGDPDVCSEGACQRRSSCMGRPSALSSRYATPTERPKQCTRMTQCHTSTLSQHYRVSSCTGRPAALSSRYATTTVRRIWGHYHHTPLRRGWVKREQLHRLPKERKKD